MRVLVVLPDLQRDREHRRGAAASRGVPLPDADVLVVDDGSPDGTAERAEELDGELGRIDVLRRAAKSGLGSAYRAGFRIGLDRGLRHHRRDGRRPVARPGVLPDAGRRGGARRRPRDRVALRAAAARSPTGRGPARAISRTGCLVRPADARPARCTTPTAGFRAYHRRLLSQHRPRAVRADGYGFQVEMTYLSQRSRRPDRRGADRVPRPHARPLQDVEPDRGRGAAPGHALGDPRPHRRGLRRRLRGPARRDTEGMSIAECTVAGALVESASGAACCSCATGGAAALTDWSTPGGVIDATDADAARRPHARGRGGDRARGHRVGGPALRGARRRASSSGGRCGARCTARSASRASSRSTIPTASWSTPRFVHRRRVRRAPRVVRALGRASR